MATVATEEKPKGGGVRGGTRCRALISCHGTLTDRLKSVWRLGRPEDTQGEEAERRFGAVMFRQWRFHAPA